MKPKYLITLSLFNKSFSNFDIPKRFISFFSSSKKTLKNQFSKLHLRLFTLIEQIIFLMIILLFLFLLSIYFSQIRFLKKHSDFLNFSSINFHHKQFDYLNFYSVNKFYNYDFILVPIIFEKHLFYSLRKALKSSSSIKIDYG